MAASRLLVGLAVAVCAAGGVYALQVSGPSRHYTATEGQGLTLEQQTPDLTTPLDTAGHTAGGLVPEARGPAGHIPAGRNPVEAPPGPPAPVAAQKAPDGGPQASAAGVRPGSGTAVDGFGQQPGLPDLPSLTDLSTLLGRLPVFTGCLTDGLPVLCPGQTPLPPPVTAPPGTLPTS